MLSAESAFFVGTGLGTSVAMGMLAICMWRTQAPPPASAHVCAGRKRIPVPSRRRAALCRGRVHHHPGHACGLWFHTKARHMV